MGRLGDRGQDRPALVDAGRLAVEPEEQVVEDPDRIEPGRLGRERHVADRRVRRHPSSKSSCEMGRTIPIRIRPSPSCVPPERVAAGPVDRVREAGRTVPSEVGMPDFEKSPSALVARFDAVATEYPAATRRMTFGYPCLYVGGNMVSGLFEAGWFVRLGAVETAELGRSRWRDTVRADARPTDGRLHGPPGRRRRRRRHPPPLGRTGHRLRDHAAAQDTQAEGAIEADAEHRPDRACRFRRDRSSSR